jgi:hypothetical protein
MTVFDFDGKDLSHNGWDLVRLLKDLEEIKGKPLTPVQVNCLYGLLCRYNIPKIAAKLGWQVAAVRTELCRNLYVYIKYLLKCDRLSWDKVADLLEPVYYRKSTVDRCCLPENPAATTIRDEYRAQAIIKKLLVAKKNYGGRLDAGDLERKMSYLLNRLKSQLKNRDYSGILTTYNCILNIDPTKLELLNDVVTCFYHLGLPEDVRSIAKLLLSLPGGERYVNANTYYILGLIHYEWARQDYNCQHVQNAVYYFALAKDRSSLDIRPVWQMVKTLLSFRDRNSCYLLQAELVAKELAYIIDNPASNIREKAFFIIDDVTNILANLEGYWQDIFQQISAYCPSRSTTG